MKYSKILSKIALLLIFILSLNMAATVVSAQEYLPVEIQNTTGGETSITPRGEVTGYRYMYVNGIKYQRLWSYTGGYWIDPYWTRCEDQD